MRDKEKQEKLEADRRDERARKSEARHPFHLFEKEFMPGKGMKTGGHGDLIVGNHYKLKQQEAD